MWNTLKQRCFLFAKIQLKACAVFLRNVCNAYLYFIKITFFLHSAFFFYFLFTSLRFVALQRHNRIKSVKDKEMFHKKV